MVIGKNSLHIAAFQQAMHPAALLRPRSSPQQDALAIQTLGERHIRQTRRGQCACAAPGGFAWLSVADGVTSSFAQGVTEAGCLAHARRKFFDLHAANKWRLCSHPHSHCRTHQPLRPSRMAIQTRDALIRKDLIDFIAGQQHRVD